MKSDDYLPNVKEQYEVFPYPPRNPENEAKRLLHNYSGNLFVINHFCFGGKKDFRSGFRCLVAGGGTGDVVIYLAEQLRHFDAEIVYLDFSVASREVAEARAKIRGLTNITWVTESIMALPELGLGQFDYINCEGVLHHLESTEAGLDVLAGALKSGAGIYLMLYGKYGRRPVYDMQALMREYLPTDTGTRDQVTLARELLGALPASNSFKRDLDTWRKEISEDAGLFDLLLHSQDRCFTVRDVYDLADSAGLQLLGFGGPQARRYDPLCSLEEPVLIDRISKLDTRTRQSIGELLNCNIARHEFFLGHDVDSVATFDDQNNTLIAIGSMFKKAPAIAASMAEGRTMAYKDGSHLNMQIDSDPIAKIVYENMQGRTSLKTIFENIQRQFPSISGQDIRRDVRQVYDVLHSYGYLYLLAEGSYGVGMPDFDQLLAATTTAPKANKIPDFLRNKPD